MAWMFFFERCCKICLICLVDLAVVDCWRAVIYTRKPGFVVHTIQGLRLAILSAYVHISHTSFSSHSPVNTTGKSKLVVYHPARPHNPRGLSSQSIISEGVSIHPSANCQQTLNQGNSAFQAYHRITTKADRKKWQSLKIGCCWKITWSHFLSSSFCLHLSQVVHFWSNSMMQKIINIRIYVWLHTPGRTKRFKQKSTNQLHSINRCSSPRTPRSWPWSYAVWMQIGRYYSQMCVRMHACIYVYVCMHACM